MSPVSAAASGGDDAPWLSHETEAEHGEGTNRASVPGLGRADVQRGVGAGDEIRTRDPLLGKQMLCQLSYSRSQL